MTESALRRLGRSAASLHKSGMLAPAAGLAVMGSVGWAMRAAASAWPETGLGETAQAMGGFGACNPFEGDFGCGHGFGCACHLLPEPTLPGTDSQV